MTSYTDLGLSNTKELFAKAASGGYAIPAYNFNNMEQLQAIIQACVETRSPVILQVSSGARSSESTTPAKRIAAAPKTAACAFVKPLRDAFRLTPCQPIREH